MSEFSQFLSLPEDIIEDARNGKMIVLVDAEDRENEGDLIIPAQMATPEAINFMAKFGRGLICLLPRCATAPSNSILNLWRKPTSHAIKQPSPFPLKRARDFNRYFRP